MQGQVAHDLKVGTDALHVIDEVADEVAAEVAETNIHVTNELVELDTHIIDEVVATNLVSSATTNTEVTTHGSTKSYVHR